MSIKVFDNQANANSKNSFWALASTSWQYQLNLYTNRIIYSHNVYRNAGVILLAK